MKERHMPVHKTVVRFRRTSRVLIKAGEGNAAADIHRPSDLFMLQ